MSKELSVVSEVFNGSSIRILDHEGEPAFCFPDVCRAIGMQSIDAKRSLGLDGGGNSIPINELVFDVPDSIGRLQKTRFIDEDQTYQLVMAGRSELAKEFRKFASKVLKQLRKEGVVDLRPVQTEAEKILEVVNLLQSQVAIERAAKEEAIRTKALISDKKTATALATASNAIQAKNKAEAKVEELSIQLSQSQQWITVLVMEKKFGQKFDWRPLKKWHVEKNVPVKKVHDERYGEVSAYHKDAWEEVYGKA